MMESHKLQVTTHNNIIADTGTLVPRATSYCWWTTSLTRTVIGERYRRYQHGAVCHDGGVALKVNTHTPTIGIATSAVRMITHSINAVQGHHRVLVPIVSKYQHIQATPVACT
jgi:hypothetical protein